MSGRYLHTVDRTRGVALWVEFTTRGPEVVDYAVVLLLGVGNRLETIRVYDGSHRINEMHRYTRAGGKQVASAFHSGTLSEGMNAAIDEVKRSHMAMIEGWKGR